METKRLVLAFALSAAVLIGWYVLFPPPPPAPAKPAATAAAAPKTAAPGTPAAASPATAAAPAAAAAAPRPVAPAVPVEPIVAAAAETVEVVQPLYTARLSNEGAGLTAFVLAQHRDAAGKPLDLVRQGAPYPGRTLALDPADPFLARAAKARFTVAKEENGSEKTVRFRYREADGKRTDRDLRVPQLLRHRTEGRARGPAPARSESSSARASGTPPATS